jgi:multidrug resistance protein MdtO
MHTKRILASPTVLGIWSELAPRPGRLEETLRITVAALLVAVVMLTFRMPFLFAGPYLVFILSQRETMLTRALAIASTLMAAIASVLVYAVALLAWNVAWLRVSLLALVFFMGFFLMRTTAQPVILLGPLVIFSLFTYAFDTVPFPNDLLNQLGWIWAIFGLLYVATFLTQWLFGAPTALEVFRTQMRRALAAAELTCLRLAFGHAPAEAAISSEESHDASARLKLLGATKVLRPDETARCAALLQGAIGVSQLTARASGVATRGEERSSLLAVAAWIRQLRLRVLRGEEAPLDRPPDLMGGESGWRDAIEPLFRAGSALLVPGSMSASARQKGSLLAADWSTNPVYTSFALRATLATMGSYVSMTLTDWSEIHTCMITCVVTALVVAEERERKQTLRLVGVILGGLYGLLAVVFFIPQFDSLMGLLIVLGVGTAMAAWLSTGPKRNSYAGWQMGLALYMTIVQKPHPVTDLDVIWDRFVGIVVGVLAMRLAFAFPSIASRPESSALGADKLGVDADHRKAP